MEPAESDLLSLWKAFKTWIAKWSKSTEITITNQLLLLQGIVLILRRGIWARIKRSGKSETHLGEIWFVGSKSNYVSDLWTTENLHLFSNGRMDHQRAEIFPSFEANSRSKTFTLKSGKSFVGIAGPPCKTAKISNFIVQRYSWVAKPTSVHRNRSGVLTSSREMGRQGALLKKILFKNCRISPNFPSLCKPTAFT